MIERADVENVLLKMGIPAGIKGFKYITDAILAMEECNAKRMMKEIYPMIAKENETTVSKVERAIRHAFEAARSKRGNPDETEKYIGFANCENGNSLKMLHLRMKQEEREPEQKPASDEEGKLTERRIREIVREELRAAKEEQNGNQD